MSQRIIAASSSLNFWCGSSAAVKNTPAKTASKGRKIAKSVVRFIKNPIQKSSRPNARNIFAQS
jgi:hypothetical protein